VGGFYKGENMKISEMIAGLMKIQNVHGDLPVNVFDPEKFAEQLGVEVEAALSLSEDENEKVVSVIIIDKETAQ
jgi:hypothetical protein